MPTHRYLDDKHEYWADFEDGHSEQYVSCTQLLDWHGLISEYSKNQEAALRGDMVHLAARYLLAARLDWSSVDPRIFGWIKSLDLWIKAVGWITEACEVRLWNDQLKLAGTYDTKGYASTGRYLIDLKSGVYERWHELQTALYLILEGGYRRRGALYLHEDGKIATFEPHDNPTDAAMAISLLNVYRLKNINS